MRRRKPSWWLLYAIVPLMIGAFAWNVFYGVRGTVGGIIDIAILVGGFGMMLVWVDANQGAMWNEEYRRERESAARRLAPTQEGRSLSQNQPRAAQPEALPRTGFGSARGKWYRPHVREIVTRDIPRVSHLKIEE